MADGMTPSLQTAMVLAHNLEALGLDPRNLDALVFSHAHNDHTGGMQTVLSAKPDLAVYAHPDIFRQRFSYKGGEYKPIGLTELLASVLKAASLNLSAEPVQIIPGLWTTGEIKVRLEPEGRSNQHFCYRVRKSH